MDQKLSKTKDKNIEWFDFGDVAGGTRDDPVTCIGFFMAQRQLIDVKKVRYYTGSFSPKFVGTA